MGSSLEEFNSGVGLGGHGALTSERLEVRIEAWLQEDYVWLDKDDLG